MTLVFWVATAQPQPQPQPQHNKKLGETQYSPKDHHHPPPQTQTAWKNENRAILRKQKLLVYIHKGQKKLLVLMNKPQKSSLYT